MRGLALWVVVGLIAAACGSTAAPETTTTTPGPSAAQRETASYVEGLPLICAERIPGEVYVENISTLDDPTGEDDERISAYQPFDERGGPASAYAPCYLSAEEALFDDDTVVIGVAVEGAAKAYSRSQLIAHLVNDHFGAMPILVAY